ncbi:2Fe-2S iron-sulfur cluster-binding protein [Acidocella sp.]|uniref:2Fe-2S iron-sulfur cluster-binding protein n=1 Tax=Acidocella sp. TaxID=50710 RepID=UPI00262820FB|nr:2Fe-2S iron-sulfur cluster-binding protein [Acidocella sp.]
MSDAPAPVVSYLGNKISVREGETVLNALLRAGLDVAFSCKAGSCQTCLMRCVEGELPERTQRGLSDEVRAMGYFMPCRCKPVGDMVLAPKNPADLSAVAAKPSPVASAAAPEIAYPETDPGLWAELQEGGDKVRRILEEFYDAVYADEALAPFFERVSKEHIAGQQYTFMKRCLLGEKVYFGDRPRNAHHWMVISEALMDHRQALMHKALRDNGLTPSQAERWMRLEEHFRGDIVKAEAWPKRIGDREVVFEGVGQEVLTVATLCDFCQAEIDAGTRVVVHQRRGWVSCPNCAEAAVLRA